MQGASPKRRGNVNAVYFDKLGAAIIDRPPHELQSMEKAEEVLIQPERVYFAQEVDEGPGEAT